ncbi:hypothetical protein [Streptomyces sp. NPDC059009]|uniref:hypothetical protein n=1 Tax=Streptomyces sp. NPDC059009 TaxID=3346694 RepID=UPI0036905F85
MRHKLASALGATVMMGALITGGAATANAAQPEARSAAACSGYPYEKADESVKIRKSKKASATAVGLLPKGAKAKKLKCNVQYGGYFKGCDPNAGATWHHKWWYISYKGIKGYVPALCTTFSK